MQFETLMLRGLFIACLTVCGLIFGAMMATTSSGVQPAVARTTQSIAAMPLAAPAICALQADGVICLPQS